MIDNMIKLKEILKEVSDKEPSSITARSPLAVEILKKAFKEESPKTKFKVKRGNFEFNLEVESERSVSCLLKFWDLKL